MDRRRFLTAGGAACVAAAGLAAPSNLYAAEPKRRMRLRLVYSLHGPKQEVPDWPNKGFDFVPVMDRITSLLKAECPEFDYVVSLANGPDQAKQIVAEDGADAVDGYIVYQMNCWNQVVQTIAATGKPVLYADFQYAGSGGFLVYNAAFLRAGAANVGFVASSKVRDLVEAVRCFGCVGRGAAPGEFVHAVDAVRVSGTPAAGDQACIPDPLETLPIDECLERMRNSRILAVRDQNAGPAPAIMGIPIEYIPFSEVNDAWAAADPDETKAIADAWERTAHAITGVSRETLEQSAAMYLAEKAVLKQHNANGITINCLGGFYGGHIHAYPCLGFHQLQNEGLIGGCECDLRSAATMVAMTALTGGRPGYISDPVIDTSKRQIIYAHCVAHNRAFGSEGPANRFEIMTHSEDRQGASERSILPLGYMTTTLEVDQGRREIVMHQGKAVENDPDDRACRTKLGVEPVGDLERLFTQWDHWSWHRVTYYGDLKEPIHALADALEWKVVEEA
jgi:hypothetical protein